MKLEVRAEKLQWAIQKLQKNQQKQLSLPILESIYLEAKDNTLILRTTNLHVGTEVIIPVKVEKEGKAAVRYDLLSQVLSNLKSKEDKIKFNFNSNLFIVKTPYSQVSMASYNADEFPTLPKISDVPRFTLPVTDFIDGVQSVMYAAAHTDIKPEISSVYIYSDGNELVFVSTDSFRLAEKRIVVENIGDFPGVIFPIKNVQEFIRVFSKEDGEFSVLVGENQISFETESLYFVSRVVDGNYPNYQQIIPAESTTTITLLHNELTSALRLVHIFSDDFHQIFLHTDKSKEKIILSAKNVEVGESEAEVDTHIQGEDIEIKFNYRYLYDVLSHQMGDSVAIELTETRKPFIVRYVGEPSFLYLIMPMR